VDGLGIATQKFEARMATRNDRVSNGTARGKRSGWGELVV
jgi:hypothetical protein